jgi:uncharacterized protein
MNDRIGPIKFILIQGTPFCNINCKYCYLDNRSLNKIISEETLKQIIYRLIECNLVKDILSIGWHCGEPLVIPLSKYEDFFTLIEEKVNKKFKVQHNFQTNATLINQDWCDFIKLNNISIGVSIDGPEHIHNFYRKTRNNKGTFDSVMNGINLLKKNNINFSTISVLTDQSVKYTDDFLSFMKMLDPSYMILNIDEIDGVNLTSTFSNVNTDAISNFWSKVIDFQIDSKIKIRDLEKIKKRIISEPKTFPDNIDLANRPFGIISFDYEGGFSTFSPELIGQKNESYNNFILGNVFDTKILDCMETVNFKEISKSIQSGIEKCQLNCDYFDFCGSCSPSSKYYENGTFDSSETKFCIATKKILTDTYLDKLEYAIARLD